MLDLQDVLEDIRATLDEKFEQVAILAIIVLVINESVENGEHDLVKLACRQCCVLLLFGKQNPFEVLKSSLQVFFTDAPNAR